MCGDDDYNNDIYNYTCTYTLYSITTTTTTTVPYNGTVAWASQEEVDNMWKIRNGCDGSEIPISTYYSDTTSCSIYNCKDAPVETCVYQNIG